MITEFLMPQSLCNSFVYAKDQSDKKYRGMFESMQLNEESKSEAIRFVQHFPESLSKALTIVDKIFSEKKLELTLSSNEIEELRFFTTTVLTTVIEGFKQTGGIHTIPHTDLVAGYEDIYVNKTKEIAYTDYRDSELPIAGIPSVVSNPNQYRTFPTIALEFAIINKGKDKTLNEVEYDYANVPKDPIKDFLSTMLVPNIGMDLGTYGDRMPKYPFAAFVESLLIVNCQYSFFIEQMSKNSPTTKNHAFIMTRADYTKGLGVNAGKITEIESFWSKNLIMGNVQAGGDLFNGEKKFNTEAVVFLGLPVFYKFLIMLINKANVVHPDYGRSSTNFETNSNINTLLNEFLRKFGSA
jgi:hypothetical protein